MSCLTLASVVYVVQSILAFTCVVTRDVDADTEFSRAAVQF